LTRLDDVLTALDTQLQNIKRQARQASRYRNIAGQIRWHEAAVLHQRMGEAQVAVAATEERMQEAEGTVAALTQRAAAAATQQADIAAGLPQLRHDEAAAAAELQRLTLARGELDAEENRVSSAQKENQRRLEQVPADLSREGSQTGDAEQAMARLDGERGTLVEAQAGEAEIQEAAIAALKSSEGQA